MLALSLFLLSTVHLFVGYDNSQVSLWGDLDGGLCEISILLAFDFVAYVYTNSYSFVNVLLVGLLTD